MGGGTGGVRRNENTQKKKDGNDKDIEEKSSALDNQVIRLGGQEVGLARPSFSFEPGRLVRHDSVLSSSPVKKGEHGLCLPKVTVHSEGLSRPL